MDTGSSLEAFLPALRQNIFYWTNRNQFHLGLHMNVYIRLSEFQSSDSFSIERKRNADIMRIR
jgi:hypothetical protein